MDDQPAAFVDWTATEALLRQSLSFPSLPSSSSSGIQSALLMQRDGSLLCVAGSVPSARLLSALASTVYSAYAEGGAEAGWGGEEEGLSLLLQCERGLVAVSRLGRFLLCMQADHSVPGGQLQLAMTLTLQHLQPLVNVYPQG